MKKQKLIEFPFKVNLHATEKKLKDLKTEIEFVSLQQTIAKLCNARSYQYYSSIKKNTSQKTRRNLLRKFIIMEITEAKQIVGDMVHFHFFSEEIEEKIKPEILKRLRNYKLKDMVLASEIVGESSGEKYIGEDGVQYTRRQLNVDDRLIAAIYVLFNYNSTPSDECVAIVSDKKKSLFVVR